MIIYKALMLLTALMSVNTSSLDDSPWDVTFNQESIEISSKQKNVPQMIVTMNQRSRGATKFEDCATRSPNSICKEGNGFRTEIFASALCIKYESESIDIIGPGEYIMIHSNFTGHLYGGPEQIHQNWPLDDSVFKDYSFVTKTQDNQGVSEPYWLSSDGYFFYVDPNSPLFVDQNTLYPGYFGMKFENKSPYPYPKKLVVSFTYCESNDAKAAHQFAVHEVLGNPSGIPDERMITEPIWSSWARYKGNINEKVIKEFANEIINYDFNISQLEIDDSWETCYGSLTFDKIKFPDMKGLISSIKEKGYRVTLWIHPFINVDCQPFHEEALQKGYFVKNTEGETTTTWWNGKAGAIDFTNPKAIDWWLGRLRVLKNDNGIDSFKFDAGETSFLPQIPVLKGELNLQPNIYSEKYVQAAFSFGDMIEVRVAHRTQHLPVFVRMLDKDSRWGFDNGLATLITTLLEMNMVGYPLVLPDMVGGNGYNGAPSKELFIRWLQANVFMPAIQYSFVPWDYDDETVEICKRYTELHAEFAPKIVATLRNSVEYGTPANPPIWWIDPWDETAQVINDEFLLGEDLLVAPVIEEAAVSRDIYLPRGVWKDEVNKGSYITGPVWLRNYSAPLDTLPYFTLQH